MPAGFVGRFLRYSDQVEVSGPDPGMPHARSIGAWLIELRLRAGEGITWLFYSTMAGKKYSATSKSLGKTGKTPPKKPEIAPRRMRGGARMPTLKEL